MRNKILIIRAAQIGAVLTSLAQAASAQVTGASTNSSPPPASSAVTSETTIGAYDKLSPGNRRIADALFDGQTVGPQSGDAWSLDKIATAHQDGRGWGDIFKDMKAQGLTNAKNLGELVSGHYQPSTIAVPPTGAQATTITKASGHSDTVQKGGRSRDRDLGAGNGKATNAGPGSNGGKAVTTGQGIGAHTAIVSGSKAGIVTARGSAAKDGAGVSNGKGKVD